MISRRRHPSSSIPWIALLGCVCLVALALPADPQTRPTLPQSLVDTSYPASTSTTYVPAGGSLQAALSAAQPGETIVLEAGATYVGPFTLPAKTGSGWIVVRTSADGLPAAGVRITPAHAPLLPKLVAPDTGPAVRTAPGAHHYWFTGVEITVAAGVTRNYGLVQLGDGSSAQHTLADVPHALVFDRVYVHGRAGVNLRRGFALNSASTAIIDSYISEVHEVAADSQAIAGWNGPGPFKILNTYLEAAGENVMFGGADPSMPNLVPSDIEIRGNHFFKPLSWRIGDPSYTGTAWQVKNLFELKNARRVLVDGNVFEHNWPHAQNGFAILFTVRNQDGSAPWSVVEDVTFTRNLVRHVSSAVNILGWDDLHTSQQTRRILIEHNLFEDVDAIRWGGRGRLFQLLNGAADVTIEHNTAFHTGDILVGASDPSTGFTYRNNISRHNLYGVGGDGTFGNPALTLDTYFPGATFARNVLTGGNPAAYPDNFLPPSLEDVRFVDLAGGDYRLHFTSPYWRAGTDGGDLGSDQGAVRVATSGAVGGTRQPAESHRTAGDFDGDGRADVAVFRPSEGYWFIALSSGGTQAVHWGTTGDVPVPADYDGDGTTDVAVFRPDDGGWYIVRSTAGATGVRWGAAGDVPVPADYDGDSLTDIATFRPSDGSWFIVRSTGGALGLRWGAPGDVPVPADYDGDGRADVAVFRPGDGGWYIIQSSLGATAVKWGENGDVPVPADYDGDGLSDVGVFRGSEQTWFVIRSLSGAAAIRWGDAGDSPWPRDVDGDGQVDLGVFRPSTGTWFIAKTSGGTLALEWGEPGDLPQ